MTQLEIPQLEYFGAEGNLSTDYKGFVKVRLWHGLGASLIIADFVLLPGETTYWFQPRSFILPIPHVCKCNNDLVGYLALDVSDGHSIYVMFQSSAHVKHLRDGSDLFRCHIRGPAELHRFADGIGEFTQNHEVNLVLYHHTSIENLTLIEKSQKLKGSSWNFQGTKKFMNISYVYLTSLSKIGNDEDLNKIAMASDGVVYKVRDSFTPPSPLPSDWQQRFRKDILSLRVYRTSTLDRRSTLKVTVDATALGPQFLYFHAPPTGETPYWEVCNPMIYRVGILPNKALPIYDGNLRTEEHLLNRIGYCVVGDAQCLDGLQAPYDEEDTSYMLKCEDIPTDSNVLRFWFEQANTDLYSNKKLDFPKFDL